MGGRPEARATAGCAREPQCQGWDKRVGRCRDASAGYVSREVRTLTRSCVGGRSEVKLPLACTLHVTSTSVPRAGARSGKQTTGPREAAVEAETNLPARYDRLQRSLSHDLAKRDEQSPLIIFIAALRNELDTEGWGFARAGLLKISGELWKLPSTSGAYSSVTLILR